MDKMPHEYIMCKFTDEQLIKILREQPTLSNIKIAKLFGVEETTIRKRKKKLIKLGWSPEHNWTQTVPDGYKIKGLTQQYNSEGLITQQWIKSTEDRERQIALFKEAIMGYVDDLPKYPNIINKLDISDYMAVFPIGDLHIGMMAWKDETGNNWSLKHVEAAFQSAFKDIVQKCPPCDIGVIINLGDFAHRDSRFAVTPNNNNHLDVDGRYAQMLRMCIRLKRFLIDLIATKCRIVLDINVTGNHDPCLSMLLSECLANVYELQDNITIDTSPTPVHYVEFGEVMLATTHGDTIKLDKLSQIAATDQSAMWGRTKYRYGLTGHVHSENKKEFPGMVVESFRTLAASDSYSTWYGFRSGRDTRALIFHKTYGKQYEVITNITMFQQLLDEIDK